MIHINLNDMVGIEEEEIAEKLRSAGPELRLTMSVSDQYQAGSKIALAENWLTNWYMAEALARHATESSCEFQEGENGAGDFEFRFVVSDAKKMATLIADFAAVLDPDDLEAGAFILDEAHEWLEKRAGEKARFPDIEQCYRDDAETAREYEGYMEAREEEDD